MSSPLPTPEQVKKRCDDAIEAACKRVTLDLAESAKTIKAWEAWADWVGKLAWVWFTAAVCDILFVKFGFGVISSVAGAVVLVSVGGIVFTLERGNALTVHERCRMGSARIACFRTLANALRDNPTAAMAARVASDLDACID
jgi:hypothetical protein